MNEERTITTRLSNYGRRLIIVERWLDRQMSPQRWRSENWHRKLTPNEIDYFLQRREIGGNVTARARPVHTSVTPRGDKSAD